LPERAFVLIPLAEIAPELVHPELGKSIAELAGSMKGCEEVRRWHYMKRPISPSPYSSPIKGEEFYTRLRG
jgi:hypothetical protein